MKKILSSALVLSMLTSSALAQYNYIGAGLVLESIEDADDNGFAGELSTGLVLDNNFGAEIKLSKSLSSAEIDDSGVNAEIDVTTITLFGTYNIPLSPQAIFVPKLGLTYFSTEMSASYMGYSGNLDDSNVNISFGIDARFNVRAETDLYAGITIFNPEFEDSDFDANHFSIGIQQRF